MLLTSSLAYPVQGDNKTLGSVFSQWQAVAATDGASRQPTLVRKTISINPISADAMVQSTSIVSTVVPHAATDAELSCPAYPAPFTTNPYV